MKYYYQSTDTTITKTNLYLILLLLQVKYEKVQPTTDTGIKFNLKLTI